MTRMIILWLLALAGVALVAIKVDAQSGLLKCMACHSKLAMAGDLVCCATCSEHNPMSLLASPRASSKSSVHHHNHS